MELYIDGVDRTDWLAETPGNPKYDDVINTRSRFSLTLNDSTNALALDTGMEVLFFEDADGPGVIPTFGGTIDRVADTLEGDKTSDLHRIVLECTSFDQILDRFFVAGFYPAQPVGDLVRDLLTLVADDGITDDFVVAGGPEVGPFTFRYEYLVDVLQLLADLANMIYFVNGDKQMYFNSRMAASYTSLSLTDASYQAASLTITRSREKYRNVQYIRGGIDLTDPREETFVGDGERQTFNTAFPLGEEPEVRVNGVLKTVGIRGVETGKEWYWNAGVNEVSQDNDATPLADTDTLLVTYRGQFPILVQARDEVEIATRQIVEGGSGIYEAMETQTTIENSDTAMSLALARLDERGYIPRTVVCVTHDGAGVKAGMLQTIALTKENLFGDFLVSEVHASCVFGDRFVYTITLLDGSGVGGWDKFFRNLLNRQQVSRTSNEDETVLLLRSLSDAVALDDDVVFSTAAPETRIGFIVIGYGEIG